MELKKEQQEQVTGNSDTAHKPTIIVAGATGDLGLRIVKQLHLRGANVVAVVREQSSEESINAIQKSGATVVKVDFNNPASLAEACSGGSCVVSALSGLRDVIVDTQKQLVQAAMQAGVPRFIPSDYCIDYTKLPQGTNRNLDYRREFGRWLENAPITATSILNGMFTDLLLGQAPLVLFNLNRVIYWGSASQLLDFTTIEDTAAYTAAAALDNTSPRFLRIAGDVINMKGMEKAASQATGQQFKLTRVGGLRLLKVIMKTTKALSANKKEVFPAWQGMQYMHNMFSGLPKLEPLDNDRYTNLKWTTVEEVLASRA